MSAERLDQLRAMLVEEPGDLFLRYAIALELKHRGEMETAVQELRSILQDDPKHIASYYQLAVMLADLGRTTDAVAACEAGALQCLVINDRKARTELLALMSTLLDEEDA